MFGLSEEVKWFSAERNSVSKRLTYLLHVKPAGHNEEVWSQQIAERSLRPNFRLSDR